jgi:hypothetical protein
MTERFRVVQGDGAGESLRDMTLRQKRARDAADVHAYRQEQANALLAENGFVEGPDDIWHPHNDEAEGGGGR